MMNKDFSPQYFVFKELLYIHTERTSFTLLTIKFGLIFFVICVRNLPSFLPKIVFLHHLTILYQ